MSDLNAPAKGPIYPAERSFLLQLHRDCDVDSGGCTGAIEHVVSGRATRFASVEELTEFVRNVLSSMRPSGDSPQ